MREKFVKYIEEGKPNPTVKDYPNQLDWLERILRERGQSRWRSIAIWNVSDAVEVHDLYEYVKEQQRLGKQGRGIFVKGDEASWRWENYHYSAAVGKYHDFLEWKNGHNSENGRRSSRKLKSRQEKLIDQLKGYAKKEYKKRLRSVRVSVPAVDPKTYLKAMVADDDGTIVCQMCCEEMPFKLRNGDDYFEAVEICDSISVEAHQLYLALCPECAAKYKFLVKNHKRTVREFVEDLRDTKEENEFKIELFDVDETALSVCFSDTHLLDVQTILNAVEPNL